jgi:hypothetical protein
MSLERGSPFGRRGKQITVSSLGLGRIPARSQDNCERPGNADESVSEGAYDDPPREPEALPRKGHGDDHRDEKQSGVPEPQNRPPTVWSRLWQRPSQPRRGLNSSCPRDGQGRISRIVDGTSLAHRAQDGMAPFRWERAQGAAQL